MLQATPSTLSPAVKCLGGNETNQRVGHGQVLDVTQHHILFSFFVDLRSHH